MNFRKTTKWLAHSYCPGLTGWFKYFGTRVFIPKRAWILEQACEQGIYEAELLGLIQGLIAPNSWYFDVGANVGLMSVPVLSQRSDVNVMSFEPSPNASPYLRKTWQECPWKDRWVIKPMAAGAAKGTAEFSFGPSTLGGYDGLHYTNRVAKVGTETVEVTTLDEEWAALGKPRVSFIKMDIEGAEIQALSGAAELLKACQPYVIVEWYSENLAPYGAKAGDLLKFANRFSYDVVSVPTMSVVNTVAMLKVLMVRTSAFMFVPAKP